MNPTARDIREQIEDFDWTRPLDEIAAMLIEAGFQLRDLDDANHITKINEAA